MIDFICDMLKLIGDFVLRALLIGGVAMGVAWGWFWYQGKEKREKQEQTARQEAQKRLQATLDKIPEETRNALANAGQEALEKLQQRTGAGSATVAEDIGAVGNFVVADKGGKFCQTVTAMNGNLQIVTDHYWGKLGTSYMDHTETSVPFSAFDFAAKSMEDHHGLDGVGAVHAWTLRIGLKKPQVSTQTSWAWDTDDSDGRTQMAHFLAVKPRMESNSRHSIELNFDRPAQAERFIAAVRAMKAKAK